MNRRHFLGAAASAAGGMALGLPAVSQELNWRAWRVNGPRVNDHLAKLSQYGRNSEGGVSRTAFSQVDIDGREFAMGLMRAAGLDVRVDPVGNILGHREGTVAGARPVVFGSHIDSVPRGGNYDGDVGSMSAIEVAHTLGERRYRSRHPLLVAIWCDEESGLTGSRGFIGDLTAEDLARRDPSGATLAERIRRIGGDPDRLGEAAHPPESITAYVELHIEQGGMLDRTGVQIGIVEGIVGILQHEVTLEGFANHAGTTPMAERQNALLPAAELVLAVDRTVKSVPGRQVGTVGRLEVEPGAPNVIPGRVRLTVELRDLSMEKIEGLWREIDANARTLATKHGATYTASRRSALAPALSDPRVREVIAEVTRALNLSSQVMPSGAGHDAQKLARLGPMGMIFVPSVGGISHSPKELTRPEDVERGANVLLQTILRLDQW